MATSPTRALRDAPPELVARRTGEGSETVEVTLYEADLDPDERTTRWITAVEADCISAVDWR